MAFNNFPYADLQDLNIDWLLQKMKETDQRSQRAFETATSAKEVAEALTQFVNNYFDNLDVQEEINNKIDAMFEAGEFDDLINSEVDSKIPGAVGDWLEDNLAPTSPPVDNTLSISGAAADAKAVGDFKKSVESFETSVDKSLGSNITPMTFVQGCYTTPAEGSAVTLEDNENYMTAYMEVVPGDLITMFNTGGTGTHRTYVFIDSDGNALNRPSANLSGLRTVAAPEGSVAVAVNNLMTEQPSGFYAYKGDNLDVQFSAVEIGTDSYMNALTASLGGAVAPMKFIPGYYKLESPSSHNSYSHVRTEPGYVCGIIPVEPGNVVTLHAAGGSGGHRQYGIVNAAGQTLKYSDNNSVGITTVAVKDSYTTQEDGVPAFVIVNNHIPTQSEGYYAYRGAPSTFDVGGLIRDLVNSYGNNGVFTESFTVEVPYNNDIRNLIFSVEASYTLGGNALPPTIQFAEGPGLNVTTRFELGGNGESVLKQWRVVRYPTDITPLEVRVEIPAGCTVNMKYIGVEVTDTIYRTNNGIRLNAHRRMPTTPYDNIQGVVLAAKAGYPAMIQIPKRTQDGVWLCYHDDSIDVDGTYLRQSNGDLLNSSYDGKAWSAIGYAEAYGWDWGISKGEIYKGTKPMTVEAFFMMCAKTGMKPMLSIHPLPTTSQLAELKEIAVKCGVLGDLGIKAARTYLSNIYSVFGNDVESYTANIGGEVTSAAEINNAISILNVTMEGCTTRKVIELLKSAAYQAYFGANQFDPFGLMKAAGIDGSISIQPRAGSPTGYNSPSQFIYGIDMDWWTRNKGVHEFTDEYNWSSGLNW